MSYLLFVIYIIGLSWAITKIPLCWKSGLNNKMLLGVFLLKVAAGAAFGLLTQKAGVADTWNYHKDALVEYHLLLTNPGRYLLNIFDSGYADKFGGMLQLNHSYWNDLKTNLTVKLISLLDIFSAGNYYVNVVLYNFLTFLGCMGLFRMYNAEHKKNHYLIAATIFLLPSLLLFSSSIHKDGLILSALGLLLFTFYRTLHFGGISLKRMLLIGFAFLLIFLIRNYVAVMLLPGLVALALCAKTSYNKYMIFGSVYIVFFTLFFTVSSLLPSVNPPQLVVQKQADFFSLERANSFIETDVLSPTIKSFASSLPQAFAHTLTRPFLTDYKLSLPLIPFAVELIFYQLTILTCIVFRKKKAEIDMNPVLLFGVLFGLSILLIIGYTVPIIWAVVRYRSIYLPFLLLPFLLNLDVARIKTALQIKK